MADKNITVSDPETNQRETIVWKGSKYPTDEQIAEILRQRRTAAKQQKTAAQEPSLGEKFATSPIGRGLSAIGTPVSDLAQGLFHGLGLPEDPTKWLGEPTKGLSDPATYQKQAGALTGAFQHPVETGVSMLPGVGEVYGTGKGLVTAGQDIAGGRPAYGTGEAIGTAAPWLGMAYGLRGEPTPEPSPLGIAGEVPREPLQLPVSAPIEMERFAPETPSEIPHYRPIGPVRPPGMTAEGMEVRPPEETAHLTPSVSELAPEPTTLSVRPPIEEPRTIEPAFTKTGKVKIGYGEELADILATSLYKGDTSKIIPKELLQNAFDAIRGVKGGEVHARAFKDYTEPQEQGKWGPTNPSYVEVRDNGIGMTHDELGTLFVNLGESGKRDIEGASGGFGLAKAAPLLGGRHVKIVSTSGKTGELLTSTMEGTPDDFRQGNVDIITKPAEKGATQGTIVTVKLPQKGSAWDAEDVIKNYGRSVRLPGKFFKASDYAGIPAADLAEPPPQNVISRSEIPGVAKVVMYKTPETTSLLGASNTIQAEINNNGLYQFSIPIGVERAEGVPKRIAVDIQSLVPEKDANYPFTSNREELRDVIKKHVVDTIKKEIVEPAQMRGTNIVQAKYDQLPQFPSGARFYDVGARMTPDEMQEIMEHPDVQAIAASVQDAITQAVDKLMSSLTYHEFKSEPFGTSTNRSGLIFSDQVHGLHIPEPGATVRQGGKATTLINPFSFEPGTEPANIASGIWNTIKHELVHDIVSGHYDRFALGEYELARALGALEEIKWLTKFKELYEGDRPGQLKDSLQRAIQIYTESIGRPANEADPFGGTPLSRQTPELPGGREEGSPGNIRRDRPGAVRRPGVKSRPPDEPRYELRVNPPER